MKLKLSLLEKKLTETKINQGRLVQLVSIKLMQCFCEARKSQAFYTQCLDEVSSEEEKEFLLELIQEAAKTSNEIREFCYSIQKNS